jgi:hypothetical protein
MLGGVRPPPLKKFGKIWWKFNRSVLPRVTERQRTSTPLEDAELV